jgi:beta-lactamase class A
MLKLMNTILLGKVLSDACRRQLETWLLQATVGQDRIKAGLPPNWRIGHKTGISAAFVWHFEERKYLSVSAQIAALND